MKILRFLFKNIQLFKFWSKDVKRLVTLEILLRFRSKRRKKVICLGKFVKVLIKIHKKVGYLGIVKVLVQSMSIDV